MPPQWITVRHREHGRRIRLATARVAVLEDDGEVGCTITSTLGEKFRVREGYDAVADLLWPQPVTPPPPPLRRRERIETPPADDEDLFQ